MIFKFNNGDKVRCKVTGLEGIITSRTEHLNGCVRYVLQPRDSETAKTGKIPDGYHLDEAQLELITPEELKVEQKKTGGPMERVPFGRIF